MHGALYYENSVIDYLNTRPEKTVETTEQRQEKAPPTTIQFAASLKDIIKKLAKPKQ